MVSILQLVTKTKNKNPLFLHQCDFFEPVPVLAVGSHQLDQVLVAQLVHHADLVHDHLQTVISDLHHLRRELLAVRQPRHPVHAAERPTVVSFLFLFYVL